MPLRKKTTIGGRYFNAARFKKTKNPTICRVFAAEAEGVEPPVRSHGRLFSRQLR